jgi:hypothetical protein
MGESVGDVAQQVDFLPTSRFHAEYRLTQIVSHLHVARSNVSSSKRGTARSRQARHVRVFYYRSANPKTLSALSQFLPVPWRR